MVDSGYHPIKHHPLRIVLGWWTVDIILLSIILLLKQWIVIILSIILLGWYGGQWISSS